MKSIALGALAAIVMASAATAAPLAPAAVAVAETAGIEQVRLVCNEYGRCFRTGPRHFGYYGGDGYVVRRGYGYGYGDRGYYRHGYRHYGEPGVTFSFGSRGW